MPIQLLLAVLPLLPAVLANDPGADFGQAPAIQPLFLNQHKSNPLTGLSFMGVYSTNFGEQPYCCPWNPKQFEVTNPTNPAVQDSNKWGVVPMICQVADAGEGGVFNNNGTILLGNSFVLSNGSLAFHGAAGSRNGAYYYSFASTNSTLKEVCTTSQEKTMDRNTDNAFPVRRLLLLPTGAELE